MHTTVYTINKMNYSNNLSHNEEHLNVSKVYQNVSIFKSNKRPKHNETWCSMHTLDHVYTCVLFKNKIIRQNKSFLKHFFNI